MSELTIEKLKKVAANAVGISDDTTIAAKIIWNKDRKAFRSGGGEDPSKELLEENRQRHQAFARLRTEFVNVRNFNENDISSTPGHRKKPIFALDQVLLQTYAKFQDESQYMNFEFLHGEFKADAEKATRTAYMLALYSGIFRSGPMCILDIDRQLLLQTIVHFRGKQLNHGEDVLLKKAQRLANAAKSVRDAKASIQKNRSHEDNLTEAFKQLVSSSSFGEVYHDVVGQRLNDAMTYGQKENLSMALNRTASEMREDVKNDPAQTKILKEKWHNFRLLMQAFDDNGAFQSGLRIDFENAVKSYDENNSFNNDGEKPPNGLYELHPGQYQKLVDVVLEIHKVNTCLSVCGLDCEVHYISPSRYFYEFIRGMGAGINVPLIHPRIFFAYTNPDFYESVKATQEKVYSINSGLTTIIENDEQITTAELEAFEIIAREQKLLLPFCKYEAFGVSSKTVLDGFAKSISSTYADLADKVDGMNDPKLKKIKSDLEDDVGDLEVFFGETRSEDKPNTHKGLSVYAGKELKSLESELEAKAKEKNKTSNDPYETFARLAKGESIDESRIPEIAARIVFERGDGTVKRIICLPVKGSYRYMFGITNTSALLNMDVLKKYGLGSTFKKININSFLDMVLECLEQGARSETDVVVKKNEALRHFARAIHTASYREWTLTEHLCDLGIKNLDDIETGISNEEPRVQSRFHFLKGEMHYLKHMAIRGLAEKTWRGKSKIRRFQSAIGELEKSANHFKNAYAQDGTREQTDNPVADFGTMSFRLPLAYIGLCGELLILQKELGTVFTAANTGLKDASPFAGLQFGSKPSQAYWGSPALGKVTPTLVWDDPAGASEKISETLGDFQNTCKNSVKRAKNKKKSRRDVTDIDLWRFRLMRVQSMSAHLEVLQLVGMTFGKPLSIEVRGKLAFKFDRALNDYDAFLLNLEPVEPPTQKIKKNKGKALSTSIASPFSRILSRTLLAWQEDGPYACLSCYFRILGYESELDASGLPRRVSRAIRKTIYTMKETENGNMSAFLRDEADRMERDFRIHKSDKFFKEL